MMKKLTFWLLVSRKWLWRFLQVLNVNSSRWRAILQQICFQMDKGSPRYKGVKITLPFFLSIYPWVWRAGLLGCILSDWNKVEVPGVSHKSVRSLALMVINRGISTSSPISGCLMLSLLFGFITIVLYFLLLSITSSSALLITDS